MNGNQVLIVITGLIVITATLGASVFIGDEEEMWGEGLRVMATFYPLAYFAEEIGGDNVTVKTMIPANTNIHEWDPDTQDILAADTTDLFIYNGAGMEPWVEEKLLDRIGTEDKVIVECTHGLELLPAEGHEEEEGHGEEEEEHHHGDHDPHTWIDPLTAKEEARNIRDGLIAADPANATYYTSRADVLFARFDSLHTNYTSGLYGKQRDMIIVSHEAYRYLGHSYGFKVQGVIGLSADEDPNPQVYLDIIDMMEENDIYILYTNPVFSQDSVQTLKTNLEARVGGDVRILSLYTLTSPSNGLDYFAMQEANLEALKTGLMSA